MLIRKVSLRRVFFVVVLISIVFLLYIAFRISSAIIPKACTDLQSKEMFKDLCELYQNERVDGNLCVALCETQTITYKECLFRGTKGKKVIAATYNSKKVIFKSKKEHFEDYELLFSTNEKPGHAPPEFDYSSFLPLFKSHVETHMGMKLMDSEEVLLSQLWGTPVLPGDELSTAEMDSLWTLAQQSEYNYLKFFQGTEFLPKIYGSCGHFYAVEHIPSGNILDPNLLSLTDQWNSAPWPSRARIALGLLDLVAATETFSSEILNLCDVKPDNFGVTDNFVIKIIDIDISFFMPQMKDYLQQPSCTVDEDCHFFDCHGACDMGSNKCMNIRTNNNFQAICADIFVQHKSSPGLLRNPPADMTDEIDDLLTKCIQPPSDEQVAVSSNTKTFHTLHQLLAESVRKGSEVFLL